MMKNLLLVVAAAAALVVSTTAQFSCDECGISCSFSGCNEGFSSCDFTFCTDDDFDDLNAVYGSFLTIYLGILAAVYVIPLMIMCCLIPSLQSKDAQLPPHMKVLDGGMMAMLVFATLCFGCIGLGIAYCIINGQIDNAIQMHMMQNGGTVGMNGGVMMQQGMMQPGMMQPGMVQQQQQPMMVVQTQQPQVPMATAAPVVPMDSK